jgi:hypothetical protein
MTRILLLLLVTSVSACTDMFSSPNLHELDWEPQQISSSGCPDLSGHYVLKYPKGEDYRWLFLGEYKELYKTREIYHRDEHMDVFITVESRSGGIYVKADNGKESEDSFTPYDGENVGCQNSMLVSRYIGIFHRPGESGNCTSLAYGERRVTLNNSGDIIVIRTQRERCSTWGPLSGKTPSKSVEMPPFVFRRVDGYILPSTKSK